VRCCHFSGTTDEQEPVAVTTAIQEEIFLEMGVGMFFVLKYICYWLYFGFGVPVLCFSYNLSV
jgi:hypothetical protein